ncbi:TPA: PIN domain-containing protein [Vibrio diabolicus]|uniref:PIN domain-containing protein n=1 Tax=Vibrio gallaecicus TaxID=552386 RepID=A0ABV4NCQ9_9VIBR|nr:PIN domain-containing protein [Vibrio sp. MMG023]MCF6450954.1 PIN domain-containing protein [Vibrio sp. MMG023]
MNLFIDTNVFLSFYHLSNDDLEELHKLTVLLEKGEITLWLPQQIKDEFYRNRENKISDAIKKLKEQKQKRQFPQICKDYPEYPEISELLKSYDKSLSQLIKKVTDDIDERKLKADQQIAELFGKAKLIQTSQELVEKARFRMAVGNPPGKDNSLGDAINWEGLLSKVPEDETLYLVADDKDYYSVLDENKLKDFLADEWTDSKKSEIVFYRRLSQFFKSHYPDIKLASELEKELAIRDFVASGSFSSTHTRIERLSKFSEFNKSQVDELCEAALSNRQINWIIGDPDVYEFFSSLVESHKGLIDKSKLEKLEEELRENAPDDES